MKFLPTLPEVTKEAAVLIAGAVLAAFIITQFPKLKAYIKKAKGCDC